jgi:UTP--glucose-1-phosphate uridylyltransferase
MITYLKIIDNAVIIINLYILDKYGVIDGNLLEGLNNAYRVDDMVEESSPAKAPTNLAIIERYLLTDEIFNVLESTQPDKNGEIQITDALATLAK